MEQSSSVENNGRPSRFGGFAGGAALGVGLVVLIGVGWTLAGGRTPDPVQGHGAAAAVEAAPRVASNDRSSDSSPHASAALEPSLDPELERLRGELAADPDRLDVRKQLALQLLRQAQFYEAFDEAQRVLERAPDDIDGLFVRGAVRVRMGQWSRALPLLERVLEQSPDHVPALTAKGQALFKAGHAAAAVTSWQRALELSGGRNSQVEELLRQVPEASAVGVAGVVAQNG